MSVARVGMLVNFGRWNGDDLIWRVIDIKDKTLLLWLAEPNTGMNKPFQKFRDSGWFRTFLDMFSAVSKGVSWETSTLREWLNGEFYGSAFSPDEKRRIKDAPLGNDIWDKVFLLSIEDYQILQSQMPPAMRKFSIKGDDFDFPWFTRSPDEKNKGMVIAVRTREIFQQAPNAEFFVRPALFVELDS